MKTSEAQHLFKSGMFNVVSDQVLQGMRPVGNIPLEQGFEIYHDIYYSKLAGALARTYETFAWVLGPDLFHELTGRYIESQPAVSFRLSEYGANFPEYLGATAKTRGIPFLQDLAQFEWLLKEVNNAATPDPVPVENVHDVIHSNNFRISFIEAMGIFQSMYSVTSLWAHRKEPRYMYEDIDWNKPESVLIYKKDKELMVEPIDPTHAEVILDLRKGKSISQALSGFSEVISPADNKKLFHILMRTGIIDDIILL
ncbi:DNA-binding domain-containing protein [Bdellovibrio sp. SKB1291214]|uniref:HvfC/BufC N-terminal domain-containing protein n=1 Tax=Bdellovibrio sp. SKB1291214 TaxID=1732569 RepID=UPI000B519739|nr:DNA-binding domain-containing protein [Bdellovibrio sp. SKB1291214]UYL08846.1 DNA-binding domain-containing protein [Bdellovibrio sp. SKB1291214]